MRRVASLSVVVGLSGGVDSAVAAWLLKREGHKVIGVTLALAETDSCERSNSCCSPELMGRAKAIADHLGIPHYAVDQKQEFRESVVEYFVSEYAAGRTPNPCSKCNSLVRFRALAEIRSRLGADLVATGHYARLCGQPRRLARGVDGAKDQSYVLAEVDPGLLEGCTFPLGELTKNKVRRMATMAGVSGVLSPESQEICFVPGDDYRAFIKGRLGERPGNVVDKQGTVLGSHKGTYNFTIGQRKGLQYAAGRPLYVAEVDAGKSEVVVAAEAGGGQVAAVSFRVSAMHGQMPRGRVAVQVRSMCTPTSGKMEGSDTVVLDRPAGGVAPGQTIVVYARDKVVLGGTIVATKPAQP